VPASILHAAPRPKGQTPANWNPLRLQPQPFFNDKNRAFWILQSAGWGGYFILRTLSGIANAFGWSYVLHTALLTATGYSVTLLMAAAFRRLIRARPITTWIGTVLIIAVAAAAFSIIEVSSHATFVSPGAAPEGIRFLGSILLTVTLLVAWAALYYSINFYLLLEEQTRQLQRLEHQASSAQLAMLRYQLNPHFLFNTLNSISTLVLLRQTERANAMLSRLSSFLRYTLVNEPTGTVTMSQEVETLKLYLEIEKMRFEDRLRPSFIDRVLITVSDSGPGLDTKAASATSTGVGLANIRDRLAQAYGENHRFESESIKPGPDRPGGFRVLIDIPYQTESEEPR
jgi:hypothetical protein